MMPGPIRSPSVNLRSVLERDNAVRQRGVRRHHRGPRPGKGTSVDGTPFKRQCPLLPSSSRTADPVQPRSCRVRRHRLLAGEAELRPVQPHPERNHGHAPGRRGRGALPATRSARDFSQSIFLVPAGIAVAAWKSVSRDATDLQCTGWNHPIRSSRAMPSASRRSVLTGAGLQADSRDAAGQAMHVLDGRSGIRRHLRSVHDPAIGAGRASRRACHRHVRSGKDFHCRCPFHCTSIRTRSLGTASATHDGTCCAWQEQRHQTGNLPTFQSEPASVRIAAPLRDLVSSRRDVDGECRRCSIPRERAQGPGETGSPQFSIHDIRFLHCPRRGRSGKPCANLKEETCR